MNEAPQQPKTFDLDQALLGMQDDKTDLDKVIEMMFDPRNVKHLSQLTRRQRTAYSALYSLYKEMPEGLSVIPSFLMENLTLAVSEDRKGRNEMVKIITQRPENQADEQMRKGFRRWFGR